MADKKNILLDNTKKLPGWITGLIAFVTAVVGFIKLWQGDSGLVTIVLLAIGVGGGMLGCAYLAFKRTSPEEEEGGKSTWKYRQWRPWALAGLIIISLLVVGGLGYYWFLQTRPPDKIIVLVADFDGPNPDNYRVTDTILVRLRDALEPYDDVDVNSLGHVITEREGSAAARAEGETHKATIVIWGWYGVTAEMISLSAHFEVLSSPNLPRLDSDERDPLRTMAATELETYRLQSQLSAEMTFLSLFTVGIARYTAEDWNGAIDRFSAALDQIKEEQLPELDQSKTYYYRGVAYTAKGDYNHAIADYTRAIDLDPDNVRFYNSRGITFAAKDDYNHAIADYDRAIELDPNDIRAYVIRGIAYAVKGDYDQAIADYDQAIQLDDPDDTRAYVFYTLRGIAYDGKGDYNQAIADYEQAIELDTGYVRAYESRGIAYTKKGDYDQALADYNRIIELDPENALAYNNSAWILAHHLDTNYEIALEYAKQSVELNPGAYNHDTLALVYYKLEQYNDALNHYNIALSLNPEQKESYKSRGDVYLALGNPEAALKDYKTYISLVPDSPVRDEIEEIIKSLQER